MNKEFENRKYIVKDILQGDDSLIEKHSDLLGDADFTLLINTIFKDFNLTEKEKLDLIVNSWKLNFWQKPPTIEEFLTREWIGDTALNIFPHIREILIKFFDVNSTYRNLYLAMVIGSGKSTLTTLAMLYVFTHIALMRTPKKYFDMSQSGAIAMGIASFTLSKTRQLLLKPFLNILTNSPKFRRTKYEEKIVQFQQEEKNTGSNRIVWSSASSMSSLLQFSNDIHLIGVSQAENLLGLNLLTGALSELSFFVKKGISLDAVNDLISEVRGRVNNRFGTNYYARCFFDSSPYSLENSPLDRYVFSSEAEKDKKNLVIKDVRHWEYFPTELKYPKWYKSKETFTIYVGGAGSPSKIISNELEKDNYHPNDIVDVPIDLLELYQQNDVKVIRDYIGRPSSSESNLISDFSIIENMFDDSLRNIVDSIVAPANSNPEKLIWNKIKDLFFTHIGNNKYEFYRHSREFRYIAVDQSIINDTTGISMLHLEMNNKGEIIVVVDFTIAIIPTKERINLDAIIEFILDLRNEGGVYVNKIAFDRFQSENGIQKLKREGFEVIYQSVDVSKAPYLTLISYMKNSRLKAGRNIFLKNNIKSLKEVEMKAKTKIEHTIGKSEVLYNNNWETSLCGINNKDISDSLANAFYLAINDYKEVPTYQYVDKKVVKEVDVTKSLYDDFLDKINQQYKVKPVN